MLQGHFLWIALLQMPFYPCLPSFCICTVSNGFPSIFRMHIENTHTLADLLKYRWQIHSIYRPFHLMVVFARVFGILCLQPWWICISKWHTFFFYCWPNFFSSRPFCYEQETFGFWSNFVCCCGLWHTDVFNEIGKFQCEQNVWTAKTNKMQKKKNRIKYSSNDFHLPWTF